MALFNYKNMTHYVRNVVEPMLKCLHVWTKDADNVLDIKLTTNINNTRTQLTTMITNLETKVIREFMPYTGGHFTGVVSELWTDLGSSSVMDLAQANFFYKNASSGTMNFSFLNVPTRPKALTVSLIISGGAGKSRTWPSVTWNGGEPPELARLDIVTFFILGGHSTYGWHSFNVE